jgi:hypothetical protein
MGAQQENKFLASLSANCLLHLGSLLHGVELQAGLVLYELGRVPKYIPFATGTFKLALKSRFPVSLRKPTRLSTQYRMH